MKVIYLDTETTGAVAGKDRFIQLAYKVADTGDTVNELFNPGQPIEFGAMAVHHITDEMVADKPDFQDSAEKAKLIELVEDHIVVAHNAKFDVDFLNVEEVYPKYVIDSYKVAYKYLFTDARDEELSSHALQYLRYALDINIEGATAHDAWGDILVLEKLFELLVDKVIQTEKFEGKDEEEIQKKVLAHMINVSNQPRLLRTIRFGKHRGKSFKDLAESEVDYLQWLVKQSDLDDDLRYTLNHYIG